MEIGDKKQGSAMFEFDLELRKNDESGLDLESSETRERWRIRFCSKGDGGGDGG